jgi:hypothetical protein
VGPNRQQEQVKRPTLKAGLAKVCKKVQTADFEGL